LGTAGLGGGGLPAAGDSVNDYGFPGDTNSGGGGGAGTGANVEANPGGNGGSGVVVIRYLGAAVATGGTITTSGGYTYHRFTSSGTLTVG
jgi:hypothetical protein